MSSRSFPCCNEGLFKFPGTPSYEKNSLVPFFRHYYFKFDSIFWYIIDKVAVDYLCVHTWRGVAEYQLILTTSAEKIG